MFGLHAQARPVEKRLFPRPEQEELRQTLIAQILQADPHGYRVASCFLARFDVVNRLHEIHALTPVINGDLDSTMQPKIQSQLTQRIPGSRYEVITGVGHKISAEQSNQFNQLSLNS